MIYTDWHTLSLHDALPIVASFFVSRVDTEVDKRLGAIGTDEALALKSKAGIANARLAFELYEQKFASDRATARSEEHTSELQSLMRISYAAFCFKTTKKLTYIIITYTPPPTYIDHN